VKLPWNRRAGLMFRCPRCEGPRRRAHQWAGATSAISAGAVVIKPPSRPVPSWRQQSTSDTLVPHAFYLAAKPRQEFRTSSEACIRVVNYRTACCFRTRFMQAMKEVRRAYVSEEALQVDDA